MAQSGSVAYVVSAFVGAAVVFAGLVAIFALLLGLPTMWLWNWLMPDIFGLPTIGFWQAVGLFFLSSLLFRSSSSSSSSK